MIEVLAKKYKYRFHHAEDFVELKTELTAFGIKIRYFDGDDNFPDIVGYLRWDSNLHRPVFVVKNIMSDKNKVKIILAGLWNLYHIYKYEPWDPKELGQYTKDGLLFLLEWQIVEEDGKTKNETVSFIRNYTNTP